MRKLLLISLAAAGILFPASAQTERIIDDYLMGFEGFSGGEDFPPGWEISSTLPDGISTSFVYKIEATGGQQTNLQSQVGTARLAATTSQPSGGGVYLVSPPMMGKVKFATRPKSYSEKGPLKIFKMEKDANGDLVPGEELKITGTVFSSNYSWDSTTPYVTLDTYARIGIMMGNGYIDNIQADHALVPEYRGLMIDKSTPYIEPTGDICADAEGCALLTAKVNLLNYGTIDLESGFDNYTVSLVRSSDGAVVSTVDVPESIAAGRGAEMSLQFEYNLADPTLDENNVKLRLRENLKGSESDEKTKTIRAYTAQLKIKDGSSDVANGVVQHIGLIKSGYEKVWNFSNPGTAPLTVSELTLPEGITCSNQLPVVINPGATENFAFVFSPQSTGVSEESINIAHNGNANSVSKIDCRIAYAGEGVYSTDCTEGIPMAWNNGADNKKPFTINKKGSNSYLSAPDYDSRIVTPKITLEDGEHITVGISRENNYTWKEQYMKVSYSSDRENWIEILDFSSKNEPSGFNAGSGLDDLKYVELSDIPAGDWYVAFDSKNGIIDDFFGGVLTPGVHDIIMGNVEINQQGMVNYPVNVKVPLRNAAPIAEPAASWSLSIESAGENLCTMQGTKDLEYSSSFDVIELSFTPHVAMAEMPVNVVFDMETEDGAKIQLVSEEFNIDVVPETMVANVDVGTVDKWATSSNAPFTPNYSNSICEMIYTADQLGLKQGDVINKITYYYQQTSDKGATLIRNLRLWLDNTDADTPEIPTGQYNEMFADTVSMQCVYHGSLDFSYKTEPDVLDRYQKLELQFSEPFTYDGQNLKVICRSESGTYISAYIAAFNASGKVVYWAKDNYNQYKDIASTPGTDGKLPCMQLGLSVESPEVSGRLLSGDNPIEGASVVLRSDDVMYKGVTDENGNYKVNILQPQREYIFMAAAAAHLDHRLDVAKYDSSRNIEDIILTRNNLSEDEYKITIDEAEKNKIHLEWAPLTVGFMDDKILYNVYLDDSLEAEDLEECEYTLTDVSDGVHNISVKAVFYPSMLDHSLTKATTVKSGMAEIVIGDCIRAVAGGLEVYASTAAQLMVYNLTGSIVAQEVVNEGRNYISLESGTYVVVLKSDSTLKQKHVVR